HRLWSRTRILEAASRLTPAQLREPFPIGPGSVFAALNHLHAAEFAWLEALKGAPKAILPEHDPGGGLAPLLRDWADLDERWGDYLSKLDDRELDRPVTRTNRAGVTSTTAAHDVLVHVCTHGFYHTAQIVNMLRRLGVAELPETNFITMAREVG
ncbi:MAG: DinB family protein, partial [Phycisphaerales bacterium]